jgi:DNA-binding MarR family transcriptional regulator
MTLDNISSAAHDEPKSVSSRPDHDALRVWLRLLSCTTLIENLISSRLRGEFDTTLPRFDVMAQLARFPDGLLMSDLSQRLMVSNGNITGITDNLERDGFVERILLPEDRRARKVRLTDKGRVAFDQMAVTHEGWIHDWLSSLSVDEQQVLYMLLGKLKHGMSA